MTNSQVGFAFQGDVVAGGNLLHSASGRLLKAMSDGGVDFYAVGAVIWLGKTLPIQPQHEASIRRQLSERKGTSGFLAKALSIGWGYSDIPLEISRSRAGTAALLTIGALASGCSNYIAAQCLQELMVHSGCEADMLPNLDVLKTLVAHLAPFMYDCGFSRVLSHISMAARRELLLLKDDTPEPYLGFKSAELLTQGDAGTWVSALRQLILTSQRKESIFIFAGQRATWLASYASYVLGMAVKLVYSGSILWESGGDHGSVTLLVGHQSVEPSSITSYGNFISLQEGTDRGIRMLELQHPMKNALDLELSQWPRIPQQVIEAIKKAIVMFALAAMTSLEIGLPAIDNLPIAYRNSLKLSSPINGSFPERGQALYDVLIDIGIPRSIIDDCASIPSIRDLRDDYFGSEFETEILKVYPAGSYKTDERVTNGIKLIVLSFASIAVSLVPCTYDLDSLYFNQKVTSGYVTTRWIHTIQSRTSFAKSEQNKLKEFGFTEGQLTYSNLFEHLHVLLGASSTPNETLSGYTRHNFTAAKLLATSNESMTIYYKAILSDEPFNIKGQIFAIESGKIALNGAIRSLVVETTKIRNPPIPIKYNMTALAERASIQPHYMDSTLSLKMYTRLCENYVELYALIIDRSTGHSEADVETLPIAANIVGMWEAKVVDKCNHRNDDPFQNESRSGNVYVGGFGANCKGTTNIFALKGRLLEQLFQHARANPRFLEKRPLYLDNPTFSPDRCILQISSCLNCAYQESHSYTFSDKVSIIMAG